MKSLVRKTCLLGAVSALAFSLAPRSAVADDIAGLDVDLGGYIQPGLTMVRNSEFNDDDQDGFEFANARLIGAAWQTFSPELAGEFKFNFDVNQGNFSVRDVFGSIIWRDGLLAVDAGQMKTPFGLALVQSEARLELPGSPRLRQIAFGRDLGLRVRGKVDPAGVGIRWSLMIANGEGGFRQRRNLDNEFLYVGRVEVSQVGDIGPGEPDLDGGDLRLSAALNGGYAPSLGKGLGVDDVGAREFRGGADVRAKYRGGSLRAELVLADRGNNAGSDALTRYGFYIQGGYVLPWRLGPLQVQPVARFEQLDLDNGDDGGTGSTYIVDNTEVRRFDLGVSAYLAGHNAKAHLAYRRTDLLEGPITDADGGPLLDDSVVLFFQLGWL